MAQVYTWTMVVVAGVWVHDMQGKASVLLLFFLLLHQPLSACLPVPNCITNPTQHPLLVLPVARYTFHHNTEPHMRNSCCSFTAYAAQSSAAPAKLWYVYQANL